MKNYNKFKLVIEFLWKFKLVIEFLWRTSKVQIVISILVAVYCIFKLSCCNNANFPTQWSNWLDAYATGVTIFIGVLIWYNEKKQDWENELPKKLTVHFKYKGQYIMSCINAPLVGEHDVRAYGQSIGGQISKMRNNLPLETFFDFELKKFQKTRHEPLVNSYVITFYIINDKSPDILELLKNYQVWFAHKDYKDKFAKLKPIPCPEKPLTEDEAYKRFKEQEEKNS